MSENISLRIVVVDHENTLNPVVKSLWKPCPVSSGRLKNLGDVDKWSSLGLLSFSQDWSNSTLNPAVEGDIEYKYTIQFM